MWARDLAIELFKIYHSEKEAITLHELLYSNDKDIFRTPKKNHVIKFDDKTGEIQAGMGGKFNGKKISQIKSKRNNEKKDYTGESSLKEYGSSEGENDFSKATFTKKQLKTHMHHIDEVGAKNTKEYTNKAAELASKPIGGNIAGTRDRNGQIIRYNKKTCELVIANPKTKHLVSYFVVKGGNKEEAEKYISGHYPEIKL